MTILTSNSCYAMLPHGRYASARMILHTPQQPFRKLTDKASLFCSIRSSLVQVRCVGDVLLVIVVVVVGISFLLPAYRYPPTS